MEFVARLEAEIPIYGAGFKRALDPHMRAMSMTEMRGESPEQLLTAIGVVETLIGNHEGAIASYFSFRDTIAGGPRITTAFNHARRRVIEVMNRLIGEFEKSLRLIRELHEVLKKRLGGLT